MAIDGLSEPSYENDHLAPGFLNLNPPRSRAPEKAAPGRLRTFVKASSGSFSAGRQYGVCCSGLMQMRGQPHTIMQAFCLRPSL